MAGTDGEQLRDILSKRYWLVEALSEKPKTKPELVDELESSRSTINRAIDELLDVGCVEPMQPTRQQFQLTMAGQAALQFHRDYRAETERIQTNTALLNTLPADSLDKAFLAEADVYSSVRTPDIAHQPGTEPLEEANRMIGTAPVVQREYFDNFMGRLQEGGFELELILESSLVEAIEQSYEDEFAALMGFDTVIAYVTEEPLPYALWVIEQTTSEYAGITLYEDGGLKGTIVNDTDTAIAWTRNQYAEYREAASKFTQF
ncbi:helix-turn-helix transcriptional regulator [Natrinema sp. 74]|uniref:helix-turn-helix transcriptional regulator n=1 Tax=Natrinema sp. 74 TaxID=3384159 RepID=UPI0038D476A0